MARPSDTERGARIALGIAVMRASQPDLFEDVTDSQFWEEIADRAREELAAARYLARVLGACNAA